MKKAFLQYQETYTENQLLNLIVDTDSLIIMSQTDKDVIYNYIKNYNVGIFEWLTFGQNSIDISLYNAKIRYEFAINRVDCSNQDEDYNGKFGFIICNLQIFDENEEII